VALVAGQYNQYSSYTPQYSSYNSYSSYMPQYSSYNSYTPQYSSYTPQYSSYNSYTPQYSSNGYSNQYSNQYNNGYSNNEYSTYDQFNDFFEIEGNLKHDLQGSTDWSAGPAGEGVLDCYSVDSSDSGTCTIDRTLFNSPCGDNAILLCDATGYDDDIFGYYDFEDGNPQSWNSTTGPADEDADITRAMVYTEKDGYRNFLAFGIEFLPYKSQKTFVFEFNAQVAQNQYGVLNPLRYKGDLLIFVDVLPDYGFTVEIYQIQDNYNTQYSYNNQIFRKHFPCSSGAVTYPIWFDGASNDKFVPSAPWGGVINHHQTKDVNAPYSFFEGMIDLNTIVAETYVDIYTYWVSVRSLAYSDTELAYTKLIDRVGPVPFVVNTIQYNNNYY